MLKVNQVWKHLHKTKSIQPKHVIERAILRAMKKTDDEIRAVDLILRDLIESFEPRRNKNALGNGYEPLQAIHRALIEVMVDACKDKVLEVPMLSLGIDLEIKYRRFLSQLYHNRSKIDEYFNRKYVYTFVRQDISPEYQLVQAAHATYKAGWFNNAFGESQDPSKLYFTVVGVEDRYGLNDVQNHLKERGIGYQVFWEPDMENQPTAITTDPIPIKMRGDLLEYKLLRFKDC